MTYADRTTVAPEQSRADIERTLRRWGATEFCYGWRDGSAVIQFTARNRQVRFVLPLPKQTEQRFTHIERNGRKVPRKPDAALKAWDQECRSAWRALGLAIKAKLEAVERRIATFEEEFLAHVVLPDGKTVGSHVLPVVAAAYESGRMPRAMLALPESTTAGSEATH